MDVSKMYNAGNSHVGGLHGSRGFVISSSCCILPEKVRSVYVDMAVTVADPCAICVLGSGRYSG